LTPPPYLNVGSKTFLAFLGSIFIFYNFELTLEYFELFDTFEFVVSFDCFDCYDALEKVDLIVLLVLLDLFVKSDLLDLFEITESLLLDVDDWLSRS